MQSDPDRSLSDEATFAGRARPQRADVSLGDEQTLGGAASGKDTFIDDIEVVDLEARYKPEGTLGQGGMGAVLLATDTRLDRKVAIKRILGEAAGNRMAVQRFLTEAKSIAALNHPNVVQIYDYGRAKDGPFLIMEYVDGGSLLDRCRSTAIPLEEAIGLACQLCDGLGKAHDLGIIHRDIKPANVLLTKDGIPKLTDFGLAKAESGDHGQTMTGAVLGTPDFMPPEQRRDASLVDARSDLWSLAATVYQMVTGRSPKIIRFDLLPPELTKVLGKALEDEKDSRYQSARELRDAIKSSVRDSAAAEPSLGEGQCPGCGTKNDSSRRFCRSCGESLEAPCLSCTKLMPMWEEICGQCGSKQLPLVEERRAGMAARQSEAESSLTDFDFDRAQRIATSLKDERDSRLRHLKGWAERFLTEIDKKRQEQLSLAARSLTEALRHEQAFDYSSGIHSLEIVPVTVRDHALPGQRETVASALTRLSTKQAECWRLDSLIKARIAGRQLAGLLPEVERLLVLRPDRQDVQKLKTQLEERHQKLVRQRDEAVTKAHKAMASHDYQGAAAALDTIDRSVITSEAELLGAEANARCSQVQKLVSLIKAAVAEKRYDGLLGPVEELLQLAPQDQEAQKLRQSLLMREEKTAADVAAIESQADAAWKACQFAQAAKLIYRIPEARRSGDMAVIQDACVDMGMAQSMAANSLRTLTADSDIVTYDSAIGQARNYQSMLAERSLIDKALEDAIPRVVQAREAFLAAQEQREREERAMRLAIFSAAVAAVVLVVAMAGLWLRSAYRSSQITSAIAQSRWEDALSFDPDNAQALEGIAKARLAARGGLPPHEILALPLLENSLGMKLKLLPAGRFTMGEPDGGSDETPHEVTLSRPFYMGVTEVTNAHWKALMGRVPSGWKDAERPVETVSWEETEEFCRRLSAVPAEKAAGRVYRLPTEAEWEYACRAGTNTKYSSGDDEGQLGAYGWYEENSNSQTHPVGQKQSNGWGLYDMQGNVSEWCSDWYGDYPRGEVMDPQGPSEGSYRVGRGGNWGNAASGCRSALRLWISPSGRINVGFRLALSPSGSEPPEAGGR